MVFRVAAGGAAAVVAALLVSGCSSSASEDAPLPNDVVNVEVSSPVIVEQNQAEATAKKGETLVFLVPDPETATIAASKEGILQLSQGGTIDGAVMSPGAVAVAPGVTEVAVSDGVNEPRSIVVTVTE